MLVLGRKCGQTVVIDERIEVTVFSIDERGNVRLGIEAPRDVPIRRSELPRRPGKGKAADPSKRRRVVIGAEA